MQFTAQSQHSWWGLFIMYYWYKALNRFQQPYATDPKGPILRVAFSIECVYWFSSVICKFLFFSFEILIQMCHFEVLWTFSPFPKNNSYCLDHFHCFHSKNSDCRAEILWKSPVENLKRPPIPMEHCTFVTSRIISCISWYACL